MKTVNATVAIHLPPIIASVQLEVPDDATTETIEATLQHELETTGAPVDPYQFGECLYYQITKTDYSEFKHELLDWEGAQ